MPRARNIKYGFFENDSLADIEPIGRLLFIGLWTLADFKGDIEYRPKKIKAQLLPYDNCDVESIVINLDLSGFISIYNVKGVSYLHVNKFTKHQTPHPNEKKKGSDIPEFKEEHLQAIDSKGLAINPDIIVTKKDKSCSDQADVLNPDTLIDDVLNPDIPIPDIPIPDKTLVELKPDHGLEIFQFWQWTMSHPKSAFDSKRKSLINRWLKHYSPDDCRRAITGCSLTPHNMGDNKEGRIYDSFELIFRDAKHIDDYMRNSDNPPAGNVKTIEQTQSEAQAQVERVKKSMGFEL